MEEGITSVNEPQIGSEHLIKQILKARIQIKGLRAAKILSQSLSYRRGHCVVSQNLFPLIPHGVYQPWYSICTREGCIFVLYNCHLFYLDKNSIRNGILLFFLHLRKLKNEAQLTQGQIFSNDGART